MNLILQCIFPFEASIQLYSHFEQFNQRGQAHFGRLDPAEVAQERGEPLKQLFAVILYNFAAYF